MAAPAPEPREGRLHGGPDHVTPYDRLAWGDELVERLLATGEQRQELEAFFGQQEYRELSGLARAAQRARPAADGCRTIIVPGIMGSQLGVPRRAPLPRDVLWLDPIDIGSGRLTDLVVPGAARVEPCGVVLYSYMRLKLHLRAAGHDPVFHHFDWRLGIDELGRGLADRLREENAARLALVGHSMGGLVCRAALALPGGERVRRVVLLGTPNGGTYAPVQALRGTYAVVRKIARLDAHHSAEALAAEVFTTFPSLYHMLPQPPHGGAIDLLDESAWPRSGARPDARLLDSARRLRTMLAPADERFTVVVGVGCETVTAVSRRRDDFVYTITRHGDGTVPSAYAMLEGARHYYATVSHSDLTRDRAVAAAVIDLIRRGSTRRLPSTWRSASRAEAHISDRALSRLPAGKIDWAALTPDERRAFLQNLNEPPRLTLRVPAAAHSRRARATGQRRKASARRARASREQRTGRRADTPKRRGRP